ncbi:MAG TPA: hypothetical protein VN039_05675 [Nitrospira sp.]|nr:hypothetical protein [Nitrospira sp.]
MTLTSAWLWKLGLIFLISISLWGWGDHHGNDRGQATQAKADKVLIDKANGERDTANTQIGVLAAKLETISSKSKADKAESDKLRQQAAAAVQDLAKEQSLRKKDLDLWTKQLDALKIKPECGALKELLCPAVMDY